jgi:hypothetical protein
LGKAWAGDGLAPVQSMGHSNSPVTPDLYAHMVGGAARKAVDGAAWMLPDRRSVPITVHTEQ